VFSTALGTPPGAFLLPDFALIRNNRYCPFYPTAITRACGFFAAQDTLSAACLFRNCLTSCARWRTISSGDKRRKMRAKLGSPTARGIPLYNTERFK
jgi:hypothetical protein